MVYSLNYNHPTVLELCFADLQICIFCICKCSSHIGKKERFLQCHVILFVPNFSFYCGRWVVGSLVQLGRWFQPSFRHDHMCTLKWPNNFLTAACNELRLRGKWPWICGRHWRKLSSSTLGCRRRRSLPLRRWWWWLTRWFAACSAPTMTTCMSRRLRRPLADSPCIWATWPKRSF